jgi:hypothetical protein
MRKYCLNVHVAAELNVALYLKKIAVTDELVNTEGELHLIVSLCPGLSRQRLDPQG